MSSLAPTYGKPKMTLTHGQGAFVYDSDGQAYLDFASGIAVTSLGHNHPALTKALSEQSARLIHASNLYGIEGQEALANVLTATSFADQVFFCNSGAEAVEACLKFARRYHWHQGNPDRTEIISFAGAFHGRTLATIAAGGSPKYLEGFGPKLPGFVQVPYGDLGAAEAAIGPQTAALLVEPIQGEGGVRPHSADFMHGIRALADAHNLLLIFDEVQTGAGRTGTLWAHQHFGIHPDLLASAKGLGGGFPIGAALMTQAIGDALAPGVHGTTYGGGPLAMAAAGAVMGQILAPGFLAGVQERGHQLSTGLAALVAGTNRVVAGTRGLGLLQSIQLHDDVQVPDFVETARQQGLLCVPAGDQTVRLLPPLIVSEGEIDQALASLNAAIRAISESIKAE